MNHKVYIHEFIDIIGSNRANYMHHMTANWGPIGRRERNQLCFGVWGTVGSTGAWPQVVNMWEEDGWAGLASSFRHELGHPTLQDPSLAEWWSRAAGFRRGGTDRIMVPAPWSRTITELCTDGVRGECYAHELISVRPGSAWDLLDRVQELAEPGYATFGLSLVGGWATAMRSDDEVLLLWASSSWEQWSTFEAARSSPAGADPWRKTLASFDAVLRRILLVDAPLAPLRTGRQPQASDAATYELPPV